MMTSITTGFEDLDNEQSDDAWSLQNNLLDLSPVIAPSKQPVPGVQVTSSKENLVFFEPDVLDDEASTKSWLSLPENVDSSSLPRSSLKSRSLQTSSKSASSLQSPFVGKGTPAQPFTTMQDISSVIALEQAGSDLDAALARTQMDDDSPLSASRSKSCMDSARTSDVRKSIDTAFPGPEDAGRVSPAPFTSPTIISHRKSRRTNSTASAIFNSPQPEADSKPVSLYDANVYMDKFYKDTRYRFAVSKRNIDFHNLFRQIYLTENLLDDFSCALSREILLQGRLYVSEHQLSFYSNLLGWVTNFSIRIADIVSIQKKSTAGLFPTAILITTKEDKFTFASFVSRDLTFDFIKTIWEVVDPITPGELSQKTEQLDASDKTLQPEQFDNRIASYLMSVDGDTDSPKCMISPRPLDGSDEDSNSGSDSGETSSSHASATSQMLVQVNTKILKFKPELKFRNLGPELHPPTSADASYTRNESEIDLSDDIIDAPLGVVFDILFGSNNTSFHHQFLEDHDGSEITDYGEYFPTESDPTRLERNYNYRKALNFPLGPKSTMCIVSEVIEHRNFADCIVILTTTSTPDVPLGSVFKVKTRYVFDWAQDNKTRIRISFFLEWLGRSWVRSMIEKGSLSGQQAAAKDLIIALDKELKVSTYYVDGPSVMKTTRAAKPTLVKDSKLEKETIVTPVPNSHASSPLPPILPIVVAFAFMLLVIIFLQWRILVSTQHAARLVSTDITLKRDLMLALQALSAAKSE